MSINDKIIFSDTITENDLNIFESRKGSLSLLKFLDHTKSFGGRRMLENMLRRPLSDKKALSDRLEMLSFASSNEIDIVIDSEVLDFIEYYYTLTNIPSRISVVDSLIKSVSRLYGTKNERYIIKRSVNFLIEIIKDLKRFADKYNGNLEIINRYVSTINALCESNQIFIEILSIRSGKTLSAYDTDRYDNLFRYAKRDDVRDLLSVIYEIDVYQGLSALLKKGFCIPELNGNEGIHIKRLRHPLVENCVPNDIVLTKEKNMCFITGANMSGKSTFMKAFGIAAYLAHTGFPVPADKMTFSVYDALYTSINVTDDIGLGYSHFYSEIQRIKSVAERIKPYRLIVIFDELFRGTNLKDALEASVKIIKAFSKNTNSLFLISTHILEVAEELNGLDNIGFFSFKTELVDNELKYAYTIEEGVSNDRYGMYILNKEKIIELIE